MVIKKIKVRNVEHKINLDLPDYITPEGTLEITENGERDVITTGKLDLAKMELEE